MKRNRSIMLVAVMSVCLLGACSSGDSSENNDTAETRTVLNEGDSPVALTDNQVAEIIGATSIHCMNLAMYKHQQQRIERYRECGYSECSAEESNQIQAELLGDEITWENGEPCNSYFSNDRSYDDNLAEMISYIGAYCSSNDAEKSVEMVGVSGGGSGEVFGGVSGGGLSQSDMIKEMYCRNIKKVLDGADLTSE